MQALYEHFLMHAPRSIVSVGLDWSVESLASATEWGGDFHGLE